MTDPIINAIRSHNTNTAESVLSDLAYAVQGLRRVKTMTEEQESRMGLLVWDAVGIFEGFVSSERDD